MANPAMSKSNTDGHGLDQVGEEKRASKPGDKEAPVRGRHAGEDACSTNGSTSSRCRFTTARSGVMPGRTPLIGRLGFGELRTKTGDVVRRYFVDGGFVQVRDDVVTVLTNRAIPAQQLDAAAAATRARDARQSQRVTTEIEFADHEKADRPRARADPRRQAQGVIVSRQPLQPSGL